MDDYEKRFLDSINLFSFQNMKKAKQKYAKSASLISNSLNNLNASKMLYEKESYPESIYLLQQSIEKATKAFGIITYGITDDKKFVHNTPLIWADLFEVSKYMDSKTYPNHTEIVKKAHEGMINKYRTFLKEQKENISLSEDDQKNLEKIMTIIETPIKLDHEGFEEAAKTLGDLAKSPKSKKVYANLTENQIKSFMKQWYDGLDSELIKNQRPIGIYFLAPLAYITAPHAISTRYSERNNLKPKDYKKGLGIVDSYPLLEITSREAISDVIRIINAHGLGIITEVAWKTILPKRIAQIKEMREKLENEKRKLAELNEKIQKQKDEIKRLTEEKDRKRKELDELEKNSKN